MPTFQTYNKKSKNWVKFKFTKTGPEFLDVKQRLPHVPFKGIQIFKKRR